MEYKLLFDLINNMPTMAYYCDISGDCKFVNQAYIRFTGFTAEDVGNFRWKGLRLVHPDDVATIVAAWKSSLETVEPYSAIYRLQHVSGDYRWVQSRAFYVKNEEGNPYAWFGNIEDIHDRKVKIDELIETIENSFIKVKE